MWAGILANTESQSCRKPCAQQWIVVIGVQIKEKRREQVPM